MAFRPSRKSLSVTIVILAGAVLLLLPAIYNGYPLVNSDDGTYLSSGFKLKSPDDRPLMYGVFLNVFSLNGTSLWLAAFFQSAILSWLIIKIVQRVTPGRSFLRKSLLLITILSLTSASWTASEVLPDIWTSIALFCFILIVTGKESTLSLLLLFSLYFCAIATHMSHIMIFTIMIVLSLLFRRKLFNKEEMKRAGTTLVFLLLLTWGTILTMRTPYNKSKHVFLMASFLEKGLLKDYLAEHCEDRSYRICKYKEELPADPNIFLWSDQSPLHREGGWDSTKSDYTKLIRDMLLTPKYSWEFVKASVRYSGRQLLELHLAEGNVPFPEGTHVYGAINAFISDDVPMYKNAWQHRENIIPKLTVFNIINYVLTALALVILFYSVLLRRRFLSPALRLVIFLFILGYIINIWDCATFAQVNARYNSRVSWILVFAAVLCCYAMAGGKTVNDQKRG